MYLKIKYEISMKARNTDMKTHPNRLGNLAPQIFNYYLFCKSKPDCYLLTPLWILLSTLQGWQAVTQSIN